MKVVTASSQPLLEISCPNCGKLSVVEMNLDNEFRDSWESFMKGELGPGKINPDMKVYAFEGMTKCPVCRHRIMPTLQVRSYPD